MRDTRPQQARGISEVADIVQSRMKCGWQEISQINDNGVDGIIIDRKNGVDTGSFYYVQVKCGDGYLLNTKKRSNDYFELNLGSEYLDKHKPRWGKLQGPVIIVYVDFSTKKSWWTSLKDAGSFCLGENSNIVLIDRRKRFGEHSLGELRGLRGYVDLDRELDVIELCKKDMIPTSFSKSLKFMANEFYKTWSALPVAERTNPKLGEVIVSRVGWRHISRRGRGLDNIYQSWGLLGAAKKIIQTNTKPYQLRKPDVATKDGIRKTHDYVSLRSRCIFPNRQESVIQVVIKRLLTLDLRSGRTENKSWFYSVHEPRKAKKMH